MQKNVFNFVLASYTPEEYKKIQTISEDGNDMDPTWAEWRQGANQAKLQLAMKGMKCVEKVIDAEGLLKYCLENGIRVDQAARASYAQWLHEKDLNEVSQEVIPEIEEEEHPTTRTHSYTSPVDQLLTYTSLKGKGPLPEISYVEKFGLGPEHIPELIRMATDDYLASENANDLEYYATIHAVYALIELHAEAAIDPLLAIFDKSSETYNEWMLETLVDFFAIRSIWLEGFDHLSAFKVGTTNYSSRPDDYVTIFETDVEGEGDDIIEKTLQELEEEEEQKNTVNEVEAIIDSLPPFYAEFLPPNMLTELKRFQSTDNLLDFLRQEVQEAKEALAAAAASNLPLTEEQQNRLQLRTVLPSLIEELDDRDMYTPLGRALKVGQKFSYEYDFGSTTELKLRVVSERDGVIRDKKNTIVILARNVPPGISCCVCGKPAMRIAAGYYSAEDDAYCSSKCAKEKDENYEEMLPVINSPRVGVI